VRIAGDIGGTRARLVLLAPSGRVVRHQVLESKAFPSLEAAIQAFLGERPPRLSAAAFGVAGPVVDQRCKATNLPWVVDARVLSRKLRVKRVRLVNDLVALAIGAQRVPPSKLHVVGGAGAPKKKGANVAVIAAGTGLGEALLVWDTAAARFVPSATEGGHAEFGPNDPAQAELYLWMQARHGHVSWERLVSGMGLGNLYAFFREAKGMAERPEHEASLAAAPDRNALISQLGAEGTSEPAARAVEMFARLYGAEAGNLALKSLASGGVYVCGNIAAKMLPVLERHGFREAFEDKGRLRPLMQAIPMAVVLDSDVGLSGAKQVAMEL
jgi:glucokinase